MTAILTHDQVQRLIRDVMQDPTFRQTLLTQPHDAVREHLGVSVPVGKTLHVVQDNPQTLSIIIPQRPADWSDDLSAEAVAERLLADLPHEMDAKVRKLAETQAQLVAKAWQDEAFKQRLLRDPKGAVGQELGVGLPAEITLQAYVEDADHQYLILPPAMEDLELTDEQLERVAGGEVVSVMAAEGSVVATAVSVTMVATVLVSLKTSW